MSKRIDIRIMKLNKWYVPKSFDIEKLGKNPVVLGYFDELRVQEAQPENLDDPSEVHPFIRGYKSLVDWKSSDMKELVDYSSQEQLLFLNICEEKEDGEIGFTEKTIQEFWKEFYENKTYPYVFLSMIHISHNGKLSRAFEKIHEVFQEDYLSYLSFDYCDIVVFAKNMQISEFLGKIKKLFEANRDTEKIFFDTFSMVCFRPQYALEQRWKEPSGIRNFDDQKGTEEIFQATINISIRNHKKFRTWYEKSSGNQNPRNDSDLLFNSQMIRYNLFGRHDISITNDKADTKWLMQVMLMLHKQNNQEMFWTFETYIKVKDDDNIDAYSDTAKHLEIVYDNVHKSLKKEIFEFEQIIDKAVSYNPNRYKLPVYEVRDCICSIVKNSFAEEFVCCIYESFLHFISYIKNEIEEKKKENGNNNTWESKIAEGYNRYFTALNTLVNSTMHNERQFVQATAFNAVFYSIPPKIMAFYNAYIYLIRQILKDENCNNRYSFLIYPVFSPSISIEPILLDDEPPCDRILTVTISEESLYDIESVMYQMVHELAHYEGDNLRLRALRSRKIVNTLLRTIVNMCGMDESVYQILQQFIEANMSNDTNKENDISGIFEFHYLKNLSEEGMALLNELKDSEKFRLFWNKYYRVDDESDSVDEMLDACGIKQENQKAYIMNYTKQYRNIKYENFRNCFEIMNFWSKIEIYSDNIELIQVVYSECYADLQMILMLAMNAEDYLNTFLVKQKVPIEEMMMYPDNMIRISTIFRVMLDCHLWTVPKENVNESYKVVFGFIDKYNRKIISNIQNEESQQTIKEVIEVASKYNFQNGISLKAKLKEGYMDSVDIEKIKKDMDTFPEIASELYGYLLEVTKASLEEYQKNQFKYEKICHIRELIKTMLEFGDVAAVFNCIENELDYYKKEGCKILT